MLRRTPVLFLGLLVLLLVASAPAAAQGATDPDTTAACEADHDVPAFELLCPVTVALHIRGLFGDDPRIAEFSVLGYLGLFGLAVTVWILIVLWRILPRRYLRMIAKEKVAETVGGLPATYILSVENRRKRRPVDVEVAVSRPPKGWSASLSVEKPLPSGFKELLGEDEAMKVPLSARKLRMNRVDLKLLVTPPAGVSTEDWAELDVTAIPYLKDLPRVRRGKDVKITTLIKERTTHPAIREVRHAPAVFRVEDEVTTTVVVENKGDGEAQDLPITLFVNEEEVAKEIVTIPARGEALLEFPWRARTVESKVRVHVGS